MEKPVLEEMLKEEGFTFKRGDDFEKISNAICATADHYSNQILDAIGNIPDMDIPVIIFSLRQITKTLEEIDPEYKVIADIMESRVRAEATVTTTTVKRG